MQRLFVFLLFLFLHSVYAQIPSYYSGIDFTQASQDLRLDINILLSNTLTNYVEYTSSSSTDVWDVVKVSDLDPDDTTNQNVLLIYGYDNTDGVTMNDRIRDKDLSCHTSSCIGLWNREHVYPQSLGTYNTDFPGIGTDVHNIRACDSQMNSSRSNRIFEDGSGDAHITSSGNWYPGDEWKGDIARIIMYMEVLYPANTLANNVGDSPNTYHIDMPDIFLQWNVDDPVSDIEIQRNNYIFSIQGNRNPFIDNPYLATLIWGGLSAEDTWGVLSVEDYKQNIFNFYPNPASDLIYYNTKKEIKSIKVYSSTGKLIMLDNDLTDNQVSLPVESGLYLLLFEFTSKDYKVCKILK